jgi:hypothetical protein
MFFSCCCLGDLPRQQQEMNMDGDLGSCYVAYQTVFASASYVFLTQI